MSPARAFGAVAAAIARRPWPVLVVVAALVAAAVWGATGMGSQPVEDAFFDRDAAAYRDTEQAAKSFGGDPVVVLAQGPLVETLTPANLARLNVLETCLAGDIKRGRGQLYRICLRLSELDPVKVLAGPATFLGRAAQGISEVYQEQIDRLAKLPTSPREAVERQRQLKLGMEVVARYGLTSPPSLEDQDFINRVVFGEGGSRSGPKPRLSYLFPTNEAAQIVVRLRSDLSAAERTEALDLIRRATDDPSVKLDKVSYVVSGSPVVFDGLADSLQTGVVILALVALVLMAVALALVLGSAWRLLPLAVALAALSVAAGLLRLLGGEFSLAAVGAAPILIGLTVDYAVQIQARLDEADLDADPVSAARTTGTLGLPMIAVACVATAFGFGALLISDLPLVSEFGVMLGAGVLVGFLVTFVTGFSALALRGRQRGSASPLESFGLMPAVRRRFKPLLAMAIVAPGRIALIGLIVAACGWAVSTQARSGTEINQLLPTRAEAVKDLLEVEEATGTSGNLDLIVRAPDVTSPAVVKWAGAVRDEILTQSGYLGETAAEGISCERAELCPGPAITDFVNPAEQGQTSRQIRSVLRGLPLNEREAMIAGGLAKGLPATETNLPFAIRTGSVDRQQAVIGMVERAVSDSRGGQGPPPGVTATVTGLPVVISASMEDLAASRYLLIVAGIVAIALVLLLAYRSFRRMLVPLVPIVVAGGWSALIVAALDLPLNPLSAVLSVLVIAIATEFSVILAGRYYQEREAGAGLADALRRSYGRTGMAVATSGVTAIAGFAALAASDIGMLREFGLIAVVDLAVALAGVALILPAVLVWLERR